MASLLLSLFLALPVFAADLDLKLGEEFVHRRILTDESRSFTIGTRIDFGQYGIIYYATETSPNAPAQAIVVKVLGLYTTAAEKTELTQNYLAAKAVVNANPDVFLTFEILHFEREFMLVMPQVSNLTGSGPIEKLPLEQRVQLASEIFPLLLRGAQVLIDAGHAHNDLSLSNIGRLPDGSVRIFDFDTFKRVNTSTDLYVASNAAPELAKTGRASNVSDLYSIGVTLAQLLVTTNYNQRYLSKDLAEIETNLRDPSLRPDLKAMRSFILAAIEPNVARRQDRLLQAMKEIRTNPEVSAELLSAVENLEKSLTNKLVKVHVLRRIRNAIVRTCSGNFNW